MISLYPHNENAYRAAIAMLAEKGKAAIVHPTGTGKSFIGFKLCEDHPKSTVCWLSPSEYIFKTQIENLKSVSAGYEPENIRFFTYAKLMNMSEEDMAQIRPDYIILDEFHRCGAEMWGQGVKNLCGLFPDVPILGLSATAIRYLDNQRDMSDELFDGNVASEMTLGEAIVRGILNPPKYVLSVFSYQKDLEKYERRIRNTKNKAIRDAGEKYLEALRRALEKADGLEDIFDSHMTERTGKYIVFCADYEHLLEMQAHKEWFAKVDSAPHIYTVYTEDPTASKSFRDFKEDNDTSHLRLLYAIDALNEGIHLDDISGVILLRPTVSPIIYKQQIGRALAAGKNREPIIFDIVNNIENLYSIDSIESEMQSAVMYFRNIGLGQEIVNEHFRVLDEVRDCRALFDALNDTLTASWDIMYGYARQYFEDNGNLDIPGRYKTIDGYSLGTWLMTQRRVYAGDISGKLTEHQVELLNAIGMCWDSRSEVTWQQGYEQLLQYKEEHGDLDVPSRYVTEAGFALGSLVNNIRTAKDCGRRSVFLTPEHEQMLTDLGFIWDRLDYAWEQNYLACIAYKLKHGHLDIPTDAVSDEGLAIGTWVRRQRMIREGKAAGRLTENQIQRLNEIGFPWDDYYARQWNDGFVRLHKYKEKNGHVHVPTMYVDGTGFALGRWLKRQQDNPGLGDEKKRKLTELGVSFEKRPDSWEVRYALAEAYYREYGDLNIPPDYKADGIWLAKWLNEQRQIFIGNRNGKTLSRDQIDRLNAIGMVWESRTQLNRETAWQEQFAEAKQFYEKNGHLNIPKDHPSLHGKNLAVWVLRQRKACYDGKLTEEKAKLLESIGMVFETEDPWETGFAHAKMYTEAMGNLDVPGDYICSDGYNLGKWLANQRSNYNTPTQYRYLTQEQIKRLEKLGIVWKPARQKWLEGYRHACEYAKLLNGDPWLTNYISPDGYKTGQWLRSQKRCSQKNTLDTEKADMLAAIGFLFSESMKPE